MARGVRREIPEPHRVVRRGCNERADASVRSWGGGCEFLTLAVLVLIGTRYAAFLASGFVAVFAVVAAVHFLTYPLRNHGREDNDFRYLV